MVTKKPEPTEDVWDKEVPDMNWVAERTQPSKTRPCNFTLKGKGQNDSWLVIYYDTVQDAIDVLNDPQLDDLMDLISQKNEEFQLRFKGSSNFSKPAPKSSGGSGWSKPSAKKSYSNDTDVDAPECEHGEREWVDKGTWRAWMCPETDKSEKCDPLWANADGSIQKKRR